MDVRVVTSATEWDSWLCGQDTHQSFTQSFAWGDILIAEGKKLERLQVVENDTIIAAVQVTYSTLMFGWRYAFCAGAARLEQSALETLDDYFKKQGCIFFRFEPEVKVQSPKPKVVKSIDSTPRATTFIDVTKMTDELLAAMHAKTRYNIRLAEKKNLVVTKEKNVSVFLRLMEETAKRDGFHLHDKNHYEKILASPFTEQVTISFEGRTLAVGIFVGFGDTYTYVFGASSSTDRQLMAPYLVQWTGIQLAKAAGYRYYDFYGIAPKQEKRAKRKEQRDESEYSYDPKHQYGGVTRFKLGFGGETMERPGTFDLLISPGKYRMYQAIRRIRRLF